MFIFIPYQYIIRINAKEKLFKMPEKIKEYHKIALELFSKRKYNQAINLFKKIYELNNDDYQAIYNLGVISFTKKEYLKSSKYFKKAFEINSSPQYLSSLIESYLLSGKINKAEKIFKKNYDVLNEGDKELISNNIKKLHEFHKIKDEKENIENLFNNFTEYSQNEKSLINRDSIIKKADKLKKNIERKINEYKDEPFLLAIYAEVLTFIKDKIESEDISYKKIISFYEKSLKINSYDKGSIINLGIIYKRNDQILNAIELYNSAIQLSIKDHLIFYNLGNAYSDVDDQEKAEINLLKSIELEPNFLSAYTNIAKLYKDKNDLDKSEFYYNKMITIDSNSAIGFRGLAAIQLVKLQYKNAFKYLTRALEIDPNNKDAKQNLSIYYYRTGKTTKAVNLSKGETGVIVFKNNKKNEPYDIIN